MKQENLDTVNKIITHVNEAIQAAKDANDSVVGVIILDDESDEMIAIAATPQGDLFGHYILRGVPLVGKATDSPRALAEDLITYIEGFYDLGASVKSDITLDEETAKELGDRTTMSVAIQTGNF